MAVEFVRHHRVSEHFRESISKGRNAEQCSSKWRDMEARASEVSRSINHTLPPPLNAASPAPSAVSA